MNRLILALAMMVAAAIPSLAIDAKQPTQTVNNQNPLQYTGNLNYYGSSSYFIEASTPALQAIVHFVGSGFLYGVDCSSGAVGDTMMVFDSTTTSSISLTTRGKALTPQIFSSVLQSTSAATTILPITGQYVPPGGAKRITVGLTSIKGGSGTNNCQIQALTDAAIAAGSH